MLSARQERDGDSQENFPAPIILTAETLRNAQGQPTGKREKGEERISVFWRVFGGTILSIFALVCITVFQQFAGSINELRSNFNRLNESRGDLVKLDDFNNRIASLWNNVKDLQIANASISVLKERSALLEQQVKASQDQLGERISTLTNNLKDLEVVNAAISALKERSTLIEQQVKAAEDERKEMVRELQHLRERLAAYEGRQNLASPASGNGKNGNSAPRRPDVHSVPSPP